MAVLLFSCNHQLFLLIQYNRRQRLFVEMEQMASRPFSHVLVELQVPPNFRRRTPVPYANRCQSGKFGLFNDPALTLNHQQTFEMYQSLKIIANFHK